MSRKPVPGVIEILEDALDSARKGEARDVFLLYRDREGAYTTDHYTTDLDDMVFQLGTEMLRIRSGR